MSEFSSDESDTDSDDKVNLNTNSPEKASIQMFKMNISE